MHRCIQWDWVSRLLFWICDLTFQHLRSSSARPAPDCQKSINTIFPLKDESEICLPGVSVDFRSDAVQQEVFFRGTTMIPKSLQIYVRIFFESEARQISYKCKSYAARYLASKDTSELDEMYEGSAKHSFCLNKIFEGAPLNLFCETFAKGEIDRFNESETISCRKISKARLTSESSGLWWCRGFIFFLHQPVIEMCRSSE